MCAKHFRDNNKEGHPSEYEEQHRSNSAHTVVRTDTPAWYINPEFKVLFADENRQNLESIFFVTEVELDVNVSLVIQHDEPPPFDFFESLPPPTEEKWAVYAVTMRKTG